MAAQQQQQQQQTSTHSYKNKRRLISVQIEPTLGGRFSISCSPYLTVERFKEDISDRLGISPRKMSLLHKLIELKSGTLSDNNIQDGSEIKLVPCVESGVNTPLTMDPVSMMKHSMSNISDEQIDDFLAGKSPLSVAIRLGESVVVVNLNRAKVEEVELEPPPEKKRSSSDTASSRRAKVASSSSSNGEELSATSSLNTNPHWSSTTACSTPSVTPTVTPPCGVPIRSVVPVGVPAPNNDGGSTAGPLSKSLNAPPPTDLLIHETSSIPPSATNRRRTRDVLERGPSLSGSGLTPSLSPSLSPLVHTSPHCLSSPSSRPVKKAVRRSGGGTSSSRSKSGGNGSKLQLSHLEWEELRRLREIPSSQNGVSMKRKAVMEAIGEILKKMYAQRIKGKVPGTFKGRFSSEFTCDSDMQDIIHSKTTMTSYGEVMGVAPAHATPANSEDACHMSKARFQENEELKGKVAMLKWRMQQQKAMRNMKRKRTDSLSSPCSSSSWANELDCDLNAPPPKLRKKTGFCGLKRGFLLAD